MRQFPFCAHRFSGLGGSARSLTMALALPLLFASTAVAFDRDGRTELVWHNRLTGQNYTWNITRTLTAGATNPLPSASGTNWTLVATADFNRDGQTDLLWRDQSTGQNAVWFMNGTNRLANPGPGQIAHGHTNYSVVGTGDFSSDGYPDILWRHHTERRAAIWFLGPPHGTNLTGVATLPSPPSQDWVASATGDFNNDTHTDILWHNRVNGQISIWLMNGLHRIEEIADPVLPNASDLRWRPVTTGAFNPLGTTDIVWRHSDGRNAVWLLNGTQFLGGPLLPAQRDPGWIIGGTGGHTNMPMLSSAAIAPRARLVLSWQHIPGPVKSIERKIPGSSTWTNLLPAGDYLPRQYASQDLVFGQRYEYRVDGQYLYTALSGTPVEDRGTLLLIVDNTVAGPLEYELNRLRTNLVGDGWTLIRTNVPRHNDTNWSANVPVIASIKGFITNAYHSNPDKVRTVFLVGHVPIPYSGVLNPDGHFYRALPADGYYGDVDGIYTDSSPSSSRGNPDPRHDNINGDGKFDQNRFPSPLELAVGRIDFANMSLFKPKTEIDLLRQYLRKNERYRRKLIQFPDRIMVGNFFEIGGFMPDPVVRGLFNEAKKNGSRLFGLAPEHIVQGDIFAPGSSALWAVHGGFGGPADVRGTNGIQRTSADMTDVNKEPHVAFLSLFGSYLLDWDHHNNFMRAFLALPNYGLGAMWFQARVAGSSVHTTPLAFEQLGLGETIGSAWLRTVNDSPPGQPSYTYLAWLGDPTLRWQILEPPTGLAVNDGTNVMVSWNPPTQPGTSYLVYRAPGIDGPWTKLTPAPLTQPFYRDNPAPAGPKLYQVRALRLITTGSGSYTNISQGAFQTAN